MQPRVVYHGAEDKWSIELITKLKQCGRRRDLHAGKHLHKLATDSGSHRNRYVATALISMYSRCGSMQEARDVFENMIQHDVVSWTTLIMGYVNNGESILALEALDTMDCEPDRITYVAALKACGALANLNRGLNLHRQARERGLDKDKLVASTLVDMYSKCGAMHRAQDVFDGTAHRDVVSWNSLILGYTENRMSSKALEVFNSMNCQPNSTTFVAALKACIGLLIEQKLKKPACLAKGLCLHRQAREFGFHNDVFVASTLVDMYSKCSDMKQAREVFDTMSNRNVVSWNVLLHGYVDNGANELSLDTFNCMDCTPDVVTFVAVLKACAGLATERKLDRATCLQKGVAVHKQVRVRGFDKDLVVASLLVDMYSKCGELVQAKAVFDGMVKHDTVSWTALIAGYVDNGESIVALEMFKSMGCEPNHVTFVAAIKACSALAAKLDKKTCLAEGVSLHRLARERGYERDLFVANTLVDMYSKCGSMQLAREVFNGMLHKDIVSWSALVHGYVDNGESSLALEVFHRMDCPPNHVTYAAALKACGRLGALELGQRIHEQVREGGLERDEMVGSCLVDFYGKCGCMSAAEDVFHRVNPSRVVSWNALIGGYSVTGDTVRVFGLVKRMQEVGIQMDEITMLLVLTACNHAGLVEEGLRYFESIPRYGVRRAMEHHTCMVDMLGRANRLQEALSLVKSMPIEADSYIWMTLLSACGKWSNVEVANVAFSSLLTLNEKKHVEAGYVLLRNIYETLGLEMKQNITIL